MYNLDISYPVMTTNTYIYIMNRNKGTILNSMKKTVLNQRTLFGAKSFVQKIPSMVNRIVGAGISDLFNLDFRERGRSSIDNKSSYSSSKVLKEEVFSLLDDNNDNKVFMIRIKPLVLLAIRRMQRLEQVRELHFLLNSSFIGYSFLFFKICHHRMMIIDYVTKK